MFGLTDQALIANAIGLDAQVTSPQEIASKLQSLGTDLDIDQDGEVNALTDGLLILRFLFGLSDNSLVSNVLGQNAQRTSASDIASYLESLVTEGDSTRDQPNIILIISDDQGLDSSSQYALSLIHI